MITDLEIFPGEASDALARVYVRLPRPAGSEATLAGKVSGPYSESARTLPAEFPLRELDPGSMLLAEAIITEPCFWTLDAPFLYRVSVELRDKSQVIAAHEELWALRRPSKTP